MLQKKFSLHKLCVILCLVFYGNCKNYSQTKQTEVHASIGDSIHYFQNVGDYRSANRIILKRLHEEIEMEANEQFALRVSLFSNELSLRENDVALQTSYALDSLIAQHESDIVNLEKLGLYFHKKGVLFYRLDKAKVAIESYLRAIEYRLQATTASDLDVIKSYKNLGHAYHLDGDLRRAAEAFTQSITNHLLRAERDKSMLQSSYSFLSNVYIEMNDLDKGWKYLQSSMSLAEELFGAQSIHMAELYSSDVFQYFAGIQQVDGMINAGTRAESILRKLNTNDPDVQSILSNTYNNLAIAYEDLSDIDKSQEYLLKSISLNKVNADRIYFLIDNYLNLVSLLMNSNQYDQANLYLKDVRNILTPELDSIAFGLYYYHQAELERHEKKYTESELHFIAALKYFNAFENTNLDKIKNGIASYIQVLFDYAQLFSDQYTEGNEIANLYTYDSIFTRINVGIQSMRDDFSSQDSKIFLSSNVKSIYNHAIMMYYTLFKQTKDVVFVDKAFTIIEKNKSLAILEELSSRKRLVDANLPEELLEEIKVLEANMLSLSLEKEKAADQSHVQEQIIRADLALNQLISDISITYPQYNMLRNRSESTGLKVANEVLSGDDLVSIQYFLAEEYLYLMFVGQGNIEFTRVTIDSTFNVTISKLRTLINDSVDKVNYSYEERLSMESDIGQASKKLYQKLILPLASYLVDAENILIIPDKQIGFIPFDILSPTGAIEDYLIHNYNISYAYSMSLYSWMQNANYKSAEENVLGFAPSFDGASRLAPLAYNKTEIEQISGFVDVDSQVDDQATKSSFLNLYQDYSIIHLSTHGIVDHTKPSRSYIAFSGVTDSSEIHSSLYASEIFNLNSKAELLVLSACETAIGDIAEGEGVMSLSRAWAATGVKSIVSTLWRIDDQFTSQFMSTFYSGLQNGHSKSNALWKAKKTFLSDEVYHHPYYWASFTLMGDRATLNNSNQFQIFRIALFALGIIALLSLVYAVSKRVSYISDSNVLASDDL